MSICNPNCDLSIPGVLESLNMLLTDRVLSQTAQRFVLTRWSLRPSSPGNPPTISPGLRLRLVRQRLSIVVAWLILLTTRTTTAAANGLFADFSTSQGGFTCELHFEEAPRTVANFVGLATGDRPWVEANTGAVKARPFFDGLTFHRVIDGFMNQSGSPNGQGTDGPGFVFLDEFHPGLRHDGPGVLSMANSGPNSNGSQFFVTVAGTPHLDDRHAVFGRVVQGINVVHAINSVATDADDKPLVPVSLQSVAIRRVGPAAEAFDIHAQSLPVVNEQPLAIYTTADQAVLTFTNRPFADLRLSESADLRSWNMTSLGIDFREPTLQEVTRIATASAGFSFMTRIQYPASTRAPRSLQDARLTLEFDVSQGTLDIRFDAAGGGTFDYSGTPGTIEDTTWIQEAYRGRLWPILFSNVYPMTLRLDYASETEGTFTGTVYPPSPLQPSPVSGSFTQTAP